jgi:phage shock protein C
MNMTRLYRSETNKKIAGVCGGIGEMINADPTIIRLLVVILALVTGILPFFIGYLIAWWIVPVGKPQQSNSTIEAS